jgi:diguanylate cyclase (GGDEF)-like protein
MAENNGDRLRRSGSPEALSVSLVSAFAGDREMSDAEKTQVDERIRQRGKVFFSDLFYTITHHYFAPDIAEKLWGRVLEHKLLMSQTLKRNARITVATLDYLSNITAELSALTLISEAYASEIANLSMRDGMTGLFNHSSCYELLEMEFRNQRRYRDGIALILLDIDDFKDVNDAHGHQEGDRILVALARTLTEQVRDSDICCRFGGEEFVVILPYFDSSREPVEIAERIRQQAAIMPGGKQKITISAGVALYDNSTRTPVELIENADRALYKAKADGKNRVKTYNALQTDGPLHVTSTETE